MSGTERVRPAEPPKFYGVVIWESEDGDLYALGHHRPRLLLAAYSKFLRETGGGGVSAVSVREQRRALGDAVIEERWFRWNPDEEYMPYCDSDDPRAVAVSVARLP